jgi:hypothetical protein
MSNCYILSCLRCEGFRIGYLMDACVPFLLVDCSFPKGVLWNMGHLPTMIDLITVLQFRNDSGKIIHVLAYSIVGM